MCSMNKGGSSSRLGCTAQPLKANLSIPQLLANTTQTTSCQESVGEAVKVRCRLPPLSSTRNSRPSLTAKLFRGIGHIESSLESMRTELEVLGGIGRPLGDVISIKSTALSNSSTQPNNN